MADCCLDLPGNSKPFFQVQVSLQYVKVQFDSAFAMPKITAASTTSVTYISLIDTPWQIVAYGDFTTLVLNFQNPNNNLPWGYVQGKVANHAEGYPVIIQIYSENLPVHFAQADVAEDGTYEYKFRVRNVDGENVVNIFKGEYSVVVTKVVKLSNGGWI